MSREQQNKNNAPSLDDEQALRDRAYELYVEMELLSKKEVRTHQEERRYQMLKSQYGALYEEYEGKYSLMIEADKQDKPKDENPRASKTFRFMAFGLVALIMIVAAIVASETLKRNGGTKLAELAEEYVKWEGDPATIGDGYKIAVEDPEDVDANPLDEDKRIPDLERAENMDQLPERRHFSWTALDRETVLTWNPQIYKETYEAYRRAERYRESKDFDKYLEDENNERLILEIAHTLASIGEGMGYSNWQLASEAVNFVQNIDYVTDEKSVGKEEWPKYVVETVYDECGDCEDKAFFLAGILRAMNYDVVLIAFDGHIGVGIAGDDSIEGTSFESNGKQYFYIEPSYPGWEIGRIPEDADSKQVAIIPL